MIARIVLALVATLAPAQSPRAAEPASPAMEMTAGISDRELTALLECRKTAPEAFMAHLPLLFEIEGESSAWFGLQSVTPSSMLVARAAPIRALGRQGGQLLYVLLNGENDPADPLPLRMHQPAAEPPSADSTPHFFPLAYALLLEMDASAPEVAQALGMTATANASADDGYREPDSASRETLTDGTREAVWNYRAIRHVFALPDRPGKTYAGCEYRMEGRKLDPIEKTDSSGPPLPPAGPAKLPYRPQGRRQDHDVRGRQYKPSAGRRRQTH